MSSHINQKLKALSDAFEALTEETQERVRTIDKLIRDANLSISHLEEIQATQLRMDRLALRERGREVGKELLEKMGSSLPSNSEVLHLRFIQTLLLDDIDVGKDPRLIDALVRAMEKMGVPDSKGTDIKGKGF